MLPLPIELQKLRTEARFLRQRIALVERSWQAQKRQREELADYVSKLKKEKEQLRKEKQQLEEELNKVKQERDTYKQMVFKAGKLHQHETVHRDEEATGRAMQRGGQVGHKGVSRKRPVTIDQTVRVYLSRCPTCDTLLKRTDVVVDHTVVDVPHWITKQPITTAYAIERQWCSTCRTEVHATPKGVIPQSRLGVNLITLVLVWRYRFREVMAKIVERLTTEYGMTISQGEVAAILHRCQQWLGPRYDDLLDEIRAAPYKHADETGWRVTGENWWCWGFVSQKSVVYTIADTRGGGIPKDKLKGAVGVLVRDDYSGYTSLPLAQQSCWVHLLRKSKEAAQAVDASDEVQRLHRKLKQLFGLLSGDVKQPYEQAERQQLYQWYLQDVAKIIAAGYQAKDAQAIQTRVKHQGKNLLTALLHEGVPLTNNVAERAMRQVVVTRKVSGGSQSPKGAKTHAVNLSLVETIHTQRLPLLDTLQAYLLEGSTGKR